MLQTYHHEFLHSLKSSTRYFYTVTWRHGSVMGNTLAYLLLGPGVKITEVGMSVVDCLFNQPLSVQNLDINYTLVSYFPLNWPTWHDLFLYSTCWKDCQTQNKYPYILPVFFRSRLPHPRLSPPNLLHLVELCVALSVRKRGTLAYGYVQDSVLCVHKLKRYTQV